MTFERFQELWDKAGLNNPLKFENPICVDNMSQHTIDALIDASNGDFTAFDKCKEILAARDAGDAIALAKSVKATQAYFAKRFKETAQ